MVLHASETHIPKPGDKGKPVNDSATERAGEEQQLRQQLSIPLPPGLNHSPPLTLMISCSAIKYNTIY